MTAFLRRQPTLLAWPLFIALSFAFTFSRGGEFRGYWLWTADWTSGTIILVGPIAAAVAAWHARFHVKHFGAAARLSPAPFRPAFMVVGGEVVLALTAQLVVVVVALAYTATVNTRPGGAVWHIFPQFFILAGYVAFGALLGLAIPTPYTAPLVAIAAYVAVLPAVRLLPRALTSYGGASGNVSGLRARGSFDLAHSAFGLGTVVVAVVAGTWLLTRRPPRAAQAVAGAVGVALLAVSYGFFARTSQERFIVPLNVALSCDGSAPQVCLPDELEDLRASFASLITKTAVVEQQLGVTNGPRRILVLGSGTRAPAYRPGDPDRPMVLNGGVTNGPVAERLKSTLPYQLVDRRCLNAHTNIDLSRTIDDLELAADHVLLAITPDATTAAIPQVKRLASWPVSRRNAWLKQTLTAANACALHRMPAPVQ